MIDRLALLAASSLTLAGGALGVASSGDGATIALRDAAPSAVRMPVATGQIIHRSRDSLFHALVRIDDQPQVMIIDTGASRTILSSAAMARLGYPLERSRDDGLVRTLGGVRPLRSMRVATLTIGSTTLHDADIAVVESDEELAVLGQDVLRSLGRITLDGDVLTLS